MKTIGLDDKWDIYKDKFNNIATKDGNERLAQDVASSVRVFKGEIGFDTSRGVEYNKPDQDRQTLNHQMNEQAKLVQGVESSVVIFEELNNRTLKPVVYVTNEEGEKISIGE